jgi:5-methylthioadenosine/S-adenosylhomocysteine deaminase
LREVEDCRREHNGMTPVAYLDSVGLLRENTLLAHCVHLTDEDRKIIARRGAVISHCPVSNMKLCSGTFDFQSALGAGCRVTLGTDGASSNNNLSMVEEMKFAALAAKLKSGDPTAGKDEDIFRCATVNGASYAQVNAGIAEGCAADILLVELDHCRMVGDYNLTANLVYSADSSVMHTLICNGRVIMENHRVPHEEEIIAEARRSCDKFRR